MMDNKKINFFMRNMRFVILAVIIFITIIGCDGGLTPAKYRQWVENEKNGLLQKQSKNGYKFLLQYEPLEYIVVRESQSSSVSQDVLNKRTGALNGFVYFALKILNDKNQNAFNNDSVINKNYYLFDMQKDFKLINNKNDTLLCAFYQYENHGGVNPDEILLGFDRTNKIINEGFTLLYDANILGLGKMTFKFNKEVLQRIPKLKTI